MKRFQWTWAVLGLLALLVAYDVPKQVMAQKLAPAQKEYRLLLPFVVGPPPTVHVLSQSSARINGALVVTGEIVNDLPDSVYLVYVTVRAYDGTKQLVAINSKHVLLVHTPPGERAPFRVDLPNAPSSVFTYDISLSWSLQNRADFRTLTLLGEQIVNSNGLEVRGRVRNDDKKSIRDGRVAVTFFDSTGNIVDAAYAEIGAQRISSGSSTTYIIRVGRNVAYNRYEIRAEGSIAPEG